MQPGFALEAAKSERGGLVGLSEITWLGEQRFAMLERGVQPGDCGAIKTMTAADLAGVEPKPNGEELPLLGKALAIHLLPPLQASRGWISDEPESFAVTTGGRVFVITDNDGVDDATGGILLLEPGSRDSLL